MSLRTTIAKAVDAAFAAVGDLRGTFTVKHFTGTNTRNATDGTYTKSSVSYPCSGILTEIKNYEGRADLLATDRSLVVRTKEVAAAAASDEVTSSTGTKYRVISAMPDPSESTFELILRETT